MDTLPKPTDLLWTPRPDYLTVSVPHETDAILLDRSQHIEAGTPVKGFGRTDKYDVIGGEAWRRCQPTQPTQMWGIDYTNWEFKGPPAAPATQHLARLASRPSRIDLCFDFAVHRDYMPQHFIDALLALDNRLSEKDIGIVGQGGINTLYIGSPQSRRRLRVYRKDLQDTHWLTDTLKMPPMLRVELIAKEKEARRLWTLRHDSDAMIAAAAMMIHQRTGWQPHDRLVEVPAGEPPQPLHIVQQLALPFRQFAPHLALLDELGVDIGALAQERTEVSSRMTHWRHDQRLQEAMTIDRDRLLDEIRQALGLTRSKAEFAGIS